MKNFHSLFICILLALFISCQPGGAGSGEAVVKADVDLAIDGMVCAIGCAKTIEEKVSDMAGIISCEVNFDTKQAHIRFDKAVLSSTKIEETIEGMNEGQYKVDILKEHIEQKETQGVKQSSSEKGSSSSSDKISVKERSFSFPHLLTYFMKNL